MLTQSIKQTFKLLPLLTKIFKANNLTIKIMIFIPTLSPQHLNKINMPLNLMKINILFKTKTKIY